MKKGSAKGEQLIYHYCSNEKMANIIKTKTLRMSDISKSNDFEEMLILYPYIFNGIEQEYEKSQFDFVYKNETKLKAICSLLEETDRLIREDIDRGKLTSFVLCFSEKEDALSQWRGYASDGKGAAIGFSIDEIKKYQNKHKKNIHFDKVKYKKRTEIKSLIAMNARTALKELQKMPSPSKWSFLNELDFKHESVLILLEFYDLIKMILMNSLQYKYDGFKEEAEWRLYTVEDHVKISDKVVFEKNDIDIDKISEIRKPYLKAEKVKFNITCDDIIPYVPISCDEISDTPIKKILLGPNNRIVDTDLRLYFGNMGWNDKSIIIKHSDISYRSK